MKSTNASFDTYHGQSGVHPVYLVHFDGETTDYSTGPVGSPTYTIKQYVASITGGGQKVVPEEGSASIGSFTITILDYNEEITALLATDDYNFHRKKVTVSAGYLGMTQANFLTIGTGWVTGLKLSDDATSYIFDVTDPQKWLQRKVFRSASDSNPTALYGHPVDVLLRVLTSTGTGTNGDYDVLDEEDGLGIDEDYININSILALKDDWLPTNMLTRMSFSIREKETAKEWMENEILQPFNLYPVIDGDGKFNIKVLRPPLAAIEAVQTFDEDTIIGVPRWDMNLSGLINEVEFHYDWDASDDEFDTEDDYVDTTSINARGPGKKSLVIKSKGILSSKNGQNWALERKEKVFARFSNPPPPIIHVSSFFSMWLSEAGDVVPVTHSLLPDVAQGSRGATAERMEIINRSVDWKAGKCSFELLATAFKKNVYGTVSPSGTIVSGLSSTQFTMSAADVAKFEIGWEIAVYRKNMKALASSVTITNIVSTTVTVDSMGGTPGAGYHVTFSTYDGCTIDQQLYCFVADTDGYLGVMDDDPHLVVP